MFKWFLKTDSFPQRNVIHPPKSNLQFNAIQNQKILRKLKRVICSNKTVPRNSILYTSFTLVRYITHSN